MLELVMLYALLWILFHFGSGYVAHRLPDHLFVEMPLVGASYHWEASGKVYERMGIRSWKDRLPEAGAFFRGGFSKRRLRGSDRGYLERFLLETSRAEWSHWLTWSLSLTFWLWNPWQIVVVMVLYGAIANLPCILVQRYNRARLRRLTRILARRPHGNHAILPTHAVAHQRAIE